VTVEGVPLNHLVGSRFWLGDTLLETTRLSTPCRHIEEIAGKAIFKPLINRLSGVSVLGAVVEGGSFAKAAELIGITDSGVSREISRLGTRLGVRLLNRTTRSVTLTDEGRRFYEEVSPHPAPSRMLRWSRPARSAPCAGG
jgi:hypothetical protein